MNTAAQTAEPTTTDGAAPAAKIVASEIVELNFEDEIDEELGRPLSDSEDWAAFASPNKSDMHARRLLTSFHRLWFDAEQCLWNASECENPAEISRQYRAALRILKAMLTVIRSLDQQRNGNVQDIVVERVGEGSGTTIDLPAQDPELVRSDQLVDELVRSTLNHLNELALRCREEAKLLREVPARELRRIVNGHRIGPDRRRWETKFLDMAGHLAGQVVRLTDALERRHKPIRQHIRITRIGDWPTSKRGNKKSSKTTVAEASLSSQHVEVI